MFLGRFSVLAGDPLRKGRSELSLLFGKRSEVLCISEKNGVRHMNAKWRPMKQ